MQPDRQEVVSVRFSREELRLIAAAALRNDRPVSVWIRWIAMAGEKRDRMEREKTDKRKTG